MLSEKKAKLVMLVGPPGSGKSTFSKKYKEEGFVYVNQDAQGKLEHMAIFRDALAAGQNVIVDRMNFNRVQRLGYLEQAQKLSYYVEIHVIHEPYDVCVARAIARIGSHETIHDEETVKKVVKFFFKSYERVEDWEADLVVRHYPEGEKPQCIVIDLDGTLCNMEHRRHHVRGEGKKKNWMAFMDGIPNDTVHEWCSEIIKRFASDYRIIFCSGRGEEQRASTERWLTQNLPLNLFCQNYEYDLFMRQAGDSRKDSIVKEILLDFEILSRYKPFFFVDDRKQVYEMWRKRGFVCLACAEGDF